MLVTRSRVVAVLAAALAACGTARDGNSPASATTTCASCHGGTDNDSGAPPNDLHGNTATTSMSVGRHTAHVTAGVGCSACHPDRPARSVPGHMDGMVDVELRGLAVAGGSVPPPRFDASAGTCSNVYCHGVTIPSAAPRPAPVWTGSHDGARCAGCHDDPPRAAGHPAATECASCHPETVGADGELLAGGKHLNGVVDTIAQHPAGYADRADGAFHGPDAIAFLQGRLGVRACSSCHGADLGGGIAPSCTACHASAGWVTPAWQSNCTFCHGSRTKAFDDASDLNLAAPPEDVGGAAAGAKVGAHRPHLAGVVTSNLGCATCHAVPAPAAPLEHLDGTAAVTLTGPGGGTYDPATRTCATACHGASGSPAWDSTDPIGCAGCHAAPPATGRHPGNEPKHAYMGANCGVCHAEVAGVMPQIVDPSRHLDGAVNVKLVTGTYDGTGCSTGCHATLTRFPWAKP